MNEWEVSFFLWFEQPKKNDSLSIKNVFKYIFFISSSLNKQLQKNMFWSEKSRSLIGIDHAHFGKGIKMCIWEGGGASKNVFF